jgi:hypothetical protein
VPEQPENAARTESLFFFSILFIFAQSLSSLNDGV